MNDAQRKIVEELRDKISEDRNVRLRQYFARPDEVADALSALLAQSTPPPREPYREAYLRGYEAGKRDAAPDSATREPEGT
jgi:hypothetical protein